MMTPVPLRGLRKKRLASGLWGEKRGTLDLMREGWGPSRTIRAPRRLGALFLLTAMLIAAATLLGGASRENSLRLAAVELCALPLAMVGVRSLPWDPAEESSVGGVAPTLLALIVAVPLLQLVPLPPNIWAALPGQGPRLEALHLANLSATWQPLSLSPGETGRAALALIPPAATLLATASIGRGQTRSLAWLWIALAVAGLVLGLAQVAGVGYLYRTTNTGSLVGLFANRNHEAGFLLSLLPVAAALTTSRAESQVGGAERWLPWLFIAISIVALGVIRSRAGVILVAPAAIAAVAVAWRGRGGRAGACPLSAAFAAIGLAAGAVVVFALPPIIARFHGQASREFRFEAWPEVVAAARHHLPLGSGLGSFDRVFEAVEPLQLVGPTYFNHAHNDYLELWLETGWLGAALFALFLSWFLPVACRAWRCGTALDQAASAAILLLMAQSTVDYPLRTETLAVFFAFCCALLARRATG
jgi:O-antigen ligase